MKDIVVLYLTYAVIPRSDKPFSFLCTSAESKGEGQLEQIRAAAEQAELEERIAAELEREHAIDGMNLHEANAYSRDRVRTVRDSHLNAIAAAEAERHRAEKERRRRRRAL